MLKTQNDLPFIITKNQFHSLIFRYIFLGVGDS